MTKQVDVKRESMLTRAILMDEAEWEDVACYTMFHLKSNLYYMLNLDHPVTIPLKSKLRSMLEHVTR